MIKSIFSADSVRQDFGAMLSEKPISMAKAKLRIIAWIAIFSYEQQIDEKLFFSAEQPIIFLRTDDKR